MTDGVAATAGDASTGTGPRRLGRLGLLLGTPLLVGAAFAAHPHGGSPLFRAPFAAGDRWLGYHLVLLPLLGLLGASLYVLLADFDGPVAALGRAGVAVYGVCYLTFEALAGIAVGVGLRAVQALPEGRRAAAATVLEAVGTGPITAGFALLGTAGATVAVVALGASLRRAGAPLAPVLLLGGVPLTTVAHGSGPGDVVGMALFLVGVAWLELRWRRAG